MRGPAATADGSPRRDGDKNANGDGETGENSSVTAVGGDLSIGSISTKHVYKFRCNYCSLAFRTQVKYHLEPLIKDKKCEDIFFPNINFKIALEQTKILMYFQI